MMIVTTLKRHFGLFSATCLLATVACSAPHSEAHEVLAKSLSNLRWHAPAKSITVTFLGKGDKEKATLVVRRPSVWIRKSPSSPMRRKWQ